MELKKMENLLAGLNLKELKRIKELVELHYKKKKDKQKSERLVESYTNPYGVYFRLEKVFCNKDNCKKCTGKNKKGHGPYWYSYKNGKREYIGNKSKAELNKIKKFSNMLFKQKNNRLPYKR